MSAYIKINKIIHSKKEHCTCNVSEWRAMSTCPPLSIRSSFNDKVHDEAIWMLFLFLPAMNKFDLTWRCLRLSCY
jgi:hypothetical protein